MYKTINGLRIGCKLNANIQKSIKIDKKTEEIIKSVPGRSFSDKVRNLAGEYSKLKNK